jgi:tRNA A37 threonylcarbamoyladenosine modification protein TsaB
MYTIYLDTSDRFNNKVTLSEEGKVIEELSGNIDCAQVLKDLFEKYSLSEQNIAKIEAFKGPGSFTGLKKGITIANVLNWALSLKPDPLAFEVPDYGAEPNIQK